MNRRDALGVLSAAAVLAAGQARAQHPPARAGHDGTPLNKFHAYLCAFHVAKSDPALVVEAHHYCCPVTDDLHQCVIFDSRGPSAKILGVEYIIPDRVYRGLPDSEKKYYHPHVYEVVSGLLVAPGMTGHAEKEFMETLVTTWGKTWHTWPDPQSVLPLGAPMLMWSANKDGQVPAARLDRRDADLGLATNEIRRRRSYIGPVPQIDPPTSIEELGRQWTSSGPDVPSRGGR